MSDASQRNLDNALKERFKAAAKTAAKTVKADEVPEPSAQAAAAMERPAKKRVAAPGKIKVDSREMLPQPFIVKVYEGTTEVASYKINRKASKFLSLSDRLWRSMVKYAQAHKAADLFVVYTTAVGASVDGQEYEPGTSVMRARTDDLLVEFYE